MSQWVTCDMSQLARWLSGCLHQPLRWKWGWYFPDRAASLDIGRIQEKGTEKKWLDKFMARCGDEKAGMILVRVGGEGMDWVAVSCSCLQIPLLFWLQNTSETIGKVCEQKLWRMDLYVVIAPKGKGSDIENNFCKKKWLLLLDYNAELGKTIWQSLWVPVVYVFEESAKWTFEDYFLLSSIY